MKIHVNTKKRYFKPFSYSILNINLHGLYEALIEGFDKPGILVVFNAGTKVKPQRNPTI